jgi:hypothetical protein
MKKLRNLLESVVFKVGTGIESVPVVFKVGTGIGKTVQIPERYQHRFTSTCSVPIRYYYGMCVRNGNLISVLRILDNSGL